MASPSSPTSTSDSARRFREGERVRAALDRPGVPAGTPGKVVMASGLDWIRYRVRFDNGVELGSLDGKYLQEG